MDSPVWLSGLCLELHESIRNFNLLRNLKMSTETSFAYNVNFYNKINFKEFIVLSINS